LVSRKLVESEPPLPAGVFRDDDAPARAQPVDVSSVAPAVPKVDVQSLLGREPVSRGEKADFYQLDDGSDVALLSSAPKNVETSPGFWQRIDTRLSVKRAGGLVVVKHPLKPEFGASAAGEFAVSSGDYRVSFSLEGASADAVAAV
jgi:hypothetical protein